MSEESEEAKPSPRGWVLMTTVLSVESVLGAWLLVVTFMSFLASASEPLGQRISLLLIVVCAVLWLLVTTTAAVRRRPWSRGSSLTLQILILAAAVGVLQGIMGTPLIGSLMLVLAVAGIIASLMVKPAEYVPEKPEL